MRAATLLTGLLAALLAACNGQVGDPPVPMPIEPGVSPDDPGAPPVVDPNAPTPVAIGTAENPLGRRVRRLTADQFHRSLEVATGQSWRDYNRFAASLGQPDYAEVTEQGRELSMTFAKFIDDAARDTCRRALDADRASGEPGLLLQHALIGDREPAVLEENLRYLFLRFLGQALPPGDPALAPFVRILNEREGDRELSDNEMRDRWWAVCVGLATHTDFLTY
ncbi:MAG: hypothetical protein AAF447_05735 [Myxococcota bacterium]